MQDQVAQLKQQVAVKAVELVESGMVVGLGTGSTAKLVIDVMGEKIKIGKLNNIVGVPTSEFTAVQAQSLNIPLGDLVDYPRLDLAIDGADEVTPALNLTKGWGGALVREKLVEMHADKLAIVVDHTKQVEKLGSRGPIPVEVTPFAWRVQARWLAETFGCRVVRREDNSKVFVTDNQNYILHCFFEGGLDDPYALHNRLAGRTGVVGHGLFLDMATDVLVATDTQVIHLRK